MLFNVNLARIHQYSRSEQVYKHYIISSKMWLLHLNMEACSVCQWEKS